MKTINRFSIIMAALLLSFSLNSCKNCTGETVSANNHTVILYVDTDNINEQNIDSTCNFGQSKEISNRDFTTYVERGDDISWEGVSSSAPETDKVYITKIKFKKGKKFFKKLDLTGTKKVRGKVKKEGIKKGDSMKYIIRFTVIKKGSNSSKPFEIDPKLRMTN